MNTRKFLIGVGAAAALLSAAQAGAPKPLNDLHNRYQSNWALVEAHLKAWGSTIGGDLRVNATAIGNSYSASTEGSTRLHNQQQQLADVGSTVNLDFREVKGDVDVVAVGVCNNASLTTNGGYGSVYNDQRCLTTDPWANINVKLGDIGGDTSIAATAIANNLSIDVNNGAVDMYNLQQRNAAATYARVNADIGTTAGNVAINATAVGNNISVNQGFGRP